MVRFSLSSAGWLCTIGLLTTAIPVLAMPEGAIGQAVQPASANVEQLMAIGKAQAKKGDFEGAIGTYRQVLSIAESTHNLPLQVGALSQIGGAYAKEGRDAWTNKHDYLLAMKLYENELVPYQQGLLIARQIPDRAWEAQLLRAIGKSYISQQLVAERAAQRPAQRLMLAQKSLPFLQQALEVAKGLKDAELVKQISGQIFLSHDTMSRIYTDLGQYDLGLEEVRLMRAISKESGNPKDEEEIRSSEYLVYNNLKDTYDKPEKYDKYIEIIQKMMALTKDQKNFAVLNLQIGTIYEFRGQYAEALVVYQQALMHAQSIHYTLYEFFALTGISTVYRKQSDYPKALKIQEQALQLTQTQPNVRKSEATALNNIGIIYKIQGNYTQALVVTQKALAIQQKAYERYTKGMTPENIQEFCKGENVDVFADVCKHLDNPIPGKHFNDVKQVIEGWAEIGRNGTHKGLGNIGTIYASQGDYRQADEFYKKALAIAHETKTKDQDSENVYLGNMGKNYIDLGDYTKAFELEHQVLQFATTQSNLPGEVEYRKWLGIIATDQGDYKMALNEYQQALAISQRIKMPSQEAIVLSKIGNVEQSQANYAAAIDHYQQALTIQRKINEPANIIETQLSLGNLKRQLGDRPAALATHQEALTLAQKIGAKQLEAKALLAIATDYREQGQLDNALKGYNQALEIATTIDDLNAKPQALYGIGQLYAQQNQPDKALIYLNQALAIQQRTGVKPRQAETLSAIGQVQTQLGKYAEAQATLQQAYALAQTVGDRGTQAIAFANLGTVFAKQNQPELSIVFYKQSVSIYEDIRKGLAPLAKDQQQSYTKTVETTYRNLADLLLKNDRILEAQQILDLLKLQELDDYLRNVRGGNTKVTYRKAETELLEKYNQNQQGAIALIQRLKQLQLKVASGLTPQEDQELQRINNLQEQLVALDKNFYTKPEIQALVAQLKQEAKAPNPELLDQLRRNFKDIPHTALLYPMILADRLEIILITADAPPLHRSIPLEKGKLTETISKFMTALRDPKIDPRPEAQQLYQWLIQPIEADLTAAKVTTIIYAPDSQLRYIPLAALHDGKQWLTQRYQFNNITTTDLANLQRIPINKLQVLAGAISDDKEKSYSTKVGTFKGLPNVKAEIDNIAAIVPNTQKFIDQAFDLTTLKSRFNGFKVLHFATHGYFDINSDDKSFILFGGKTTTRDAQIATLDEVGKWTLENVDLVVLSACETGLSDRLGKTPGSFQGTGKEILGLGYQFQQAKAKATIASLWRVDDEGTQILMSAFYKHLQQENTSVVVALQQAQIDMITSNQAQLTALNQNRWKLISSTTSTVPRSVSQPEWQSTAQPFSHPYYWAPFILTGNGL